MEKKKYFLFSTRKPIRFIKIQYPTSIPKDKKITGYNIYRYNCSSFCSCLPLCIKFRFAYSQEPIYE